MIQQSYIVIANQDLPPSTATPHPNLTMDIQMMALLTGRERTLDQWEGLFRQAGLRVTRSIVTKAAFTLVEGVLER